MTRKRSVLLGSRNKRRGVEGHVEEGEDSLVHSITASIKPMSDNVQQSSSDYCISRVPERLRSVKPEAYTPVIVSIGPFHHGDPRLKPMEHLKTQYLHSLLGPHGKIERCVKELLKLETRARNCYAETIRYKKEAFVKMLLLDGCFLLELFRKYCVSPQTHNDDDQVFTNDWIFNAVHRDVLLLENQIPFFVLETLFSIITGIELHDTSYLPHLINEFLRHHKLLPRVESLSLRSGGEQILLSLLKSITSERFDTTTTTQNQITIDQPHTTSLIFKLSATELSTVAQLHSKIFRVCRQFKKKFLRVCCPFKNNNPTSLTFIPSATELSRVGIKFEKSEPSYLFNVRFHGNGVFDIPSLVVDDRTESFFRNLIALEQTSSKTRIRRISDQNQSLSNKIPRISAYVTLMDCLVNTCADVALLRDQRILYNQLGDDKEVAQLFNKLRTGIIMNPDEFYFSEVFESVNAYYHTTWNEWRAMFFREFWSTPWKRASLFAAIILLLCTIGQTVCSILQVLPHWSK